ncbi:MAG: exodeoxyribonuclease III [Arenicella sp.]|nr:exodeoxyribonuclease III [Arenicella sp.]
MKIASWNVNSLRVRLNQVLDWLGNEQPDILCLQELKMPDAEFPHAAFLDNGYHSVATGEKTYNGVAIVSKTPLQNVITDLPSAEDSQRRFIAADYHDDNNSEVCRIVNVYVPNGQALDSEKFIYKRQWLGTLHTAMREYLEQNANLVVVGDFNIAPSDLDVHDPQRWRGKIHCSDGERMILQKLMSLGLYDTFRQFHLSSDKFSWWDYRTDGYSRNEGLRIDLILSSSSMLDRARSCDIDETPRRWPRPSDHTPVWAVYD